VIFYAVTLICEALHLASGVLLLLCYNSLPYKSLIKEKVWVQAHLNIVIFTFLHFVDSYF